MSTLKQLEEQWNSYMKKSQEQTFSQRLQAYEKLNQTIQHEYQQWRKKYSMYQEQLTNTPSEHDVKAYMDKNICDLIIMYEEAQNEFNTYHDVGNICSMMQSWHTMNVLHAVLQHKMKNNEN